jgi:hypothetical protein
MAHFACINDQGIVTQVIVAEQEFVDGLEGTWVQTSYNTRGGKHYDPETGEEDDGVPLRKNYAGIGYKYDADRDAFIPPRQWTSWVLDEETCFWEAPIPMPELTEEQIAVNAGYLWDEDTYQDDDNDPKTEGWILIIPPKT